MSKFKLFGTRVLLRKRKMKEGVILLPEMVKQNQIHTLAEIVAIGDGNFHGEQKDMLVKPGDIVYLQTNEIMAANCFYEVRMPRGESDSLLNLEQTECVARMKTDEAKLDDWEMLGEYVLLKLRHRNIKSETGIVIPETTRIAEFVYYEVAKTSDRCIWDLKEGQEVIIVHGRANHIMIEGVEYAYIRDVDIHGIVEE